MAARAVATTACARVALQVCRPQRSWRRCLADDPSGSKVVLCLDVGERHIGLARTVADVGTAFPAGSIDMGLRAATARAVVDRVVLEGAGCLVVGLALGLDREDSMETGKVRGFAGFVRKELAERGLNRTVRVELVDERLSSLAVGRAAASELSLIHISE